MQVICAGDIAARIYQPGYSGYRGERQEMCLAGAAARVTWTDLLALAPGREDLSTLG